MTLSGCFTDLGGSIDVGPATEQLGDHVDVPFLGGEVESIQAVLSIKNKSIKIQLRIAKGNCFKRTTAHDEL